MLGRTGDAATATPDAAVDPRDGRNYRGPRRAQRHAAARADRAAGRRQDVRDVRAGRRARDRDLRRRRRRRARQRLRPREGRPRGPQLPGARRPRSWSTSRSAGTRRGSSASGRPAVPGAQLRSAAAQRPRRSAGERALQPGPAGAGHALFTHLLHRRGDGADEVRRPRLDERLGRRGEPPLLRRHRADGAFSLPNLPAGHLHGGSLARGGRHPVGHGHRDRTRHRDARARLQGYPRHERRTSMPIASADAPADAPDRCARTVGLGRLRRASPSRG